MQLAKQFEKEAMEYGCEMALHFESLSYDKVRRFAKGYRPSKNNQFNTSPTRQLDLICLQGC